MSNFMLKFKFGLKARLGLIPGTSRLEMQNIELKKEYDEFVRYGESKEPERFRELEELVTSQDFKDRVKHINNLRFKDTEAYHKFMEYKSMKNSREFKGYFRFVSSVEYKDFLTLDNSDEIKELEDLGNFVNSDQFKTIKRSKFKDSEAWYKYLDYKRLKKTQGIMDYFKIKHSKNYKALKELEGSKKLTHFEELHQLVNSSEFQVMKRTLKAAELKKTSEYAKYKEYLGLKSEPDIKAWLQLQEDKAFANFKLMELSPELGKYVNLENFVNSSDYINAKKDFEINKASELHKLNDYKTLKKSVKIRAYYKLKNSKDLKHYRMLHNSSELEKFQELEKYINTDEFKENKAYLESRDKFKKSPEYQKMKEYKELKKSPKLKWYNKLEGSDKFIDLIKWKLVFSDDFTGNDLDKSKWLTSFYWGGQLLKEGYSLASDKHFYTEGKNHEVNDSQLKLYTKKETAAGKAWDQEIGFFPKEFEYTSGLVNTGDSFRQQYGAFEARVRMHSSPSVFHAFWMISDKAVPHIDIFRFSGKNKKRIELNNFWTADNDSKEIQKNSGSIGGMDFSRGFFIFRLEWYPEKLVWKINNTIVKIEEHGVPQEPMYILFSSGVNSDASGKGLPTSFDIDWVRCYRLNDNVK